MARINNQVRKEILAKALAGGETVKDWAEKSNVKTRTAYAWAASAEVVDQVNAVRRGALEQAMARLSQNATAASDAIVGLVKEANSESVRLQAARAVLAELAAACGQAALQSRLDEIERRMTNAHA